MNGKWIAFVSNEGRQPEVYVQAFPSGGETFAIDGKLMTVAVKIGAGFEHSPPAPLFDVQINDASPNAFDYVAIDNGQRFLVRTPAKTAKGSPVLVMTNWLASAKK